MSYSNPDPINYSNIDYDNRQVGATEKLRYVKGVLGGTPFSFVGKGNRGENTSLDNTYKHKCNKSCEKPRLERYRRWKWFNRETGVLKPFRCRAWACNAKAGKDQVCQEGWIGCGVVKAKKLRKIMARTARLHNLTRLATLTLNPQKIQKKNPERYLLQVWRKMRIYLYRRYGQKFQYLWVKEQGKSQLHWHLHVLVNRYIPQAWLSSAWSQLGGGRVVDIRFVDVQRVSVYISKYLSKAVAQEYRGRRYGASRGLLVTEKEKDPESPWVLVVFREGDIEFGRLTRFFFVLLEEDCRGSPGFG